MNKKYWGMSFIMATPWTKKKTTAWREECPKNVHWPAAREENENEQL